MAAGLGFKTFTTGEVLTAADVNGYLMQGVLVFASAAARNAAITSPQEGQFAFTKDTNGLWYYDGAAWVASGATGDIEGVTAGVGITGGGTSGTVTITNDMATTITAAGDIVVGTGSGTYDNLPIGTTAQVLTADTTVSPYKVKWATPAAGTSGLTKIITATYSGAATTGTTFDGCFTSTYDNYIIIHTALNASSNNVNFQWQLRNSGTTTTTLYNGSYLRGVTLTSTSAASSFNVCNLTSNTDQQSAIYMSFYRNTKCMSWNYLGNDRGVSDSSVVGGGFQNSLSALGADGFILSAGTGNLSGTTTVYGVQK